MEQGVRIYDTITNQRITYITRAPNSPRADLFKCTLCWQDDTTLLIAWADYIKIAKIKSKEPKRNHHQLAGVGLPRVGLSSTGIGSNGSSNSNELFVEVVSIFQVDCMISGIVPYDVEGKNYLILAYLLDEEDKVEITTDGLVTSESQMKRKLGNRPELRIISKDGEELSSDAISFKNFPKFQCRDYSLCLAPRSFTTSTSNSSNSKGSTSKSTKNSLLKEEKFYVISPEDIVIAKPRDESDHVTWLIEQKQYEPALIILENNSDSIEMEKFDITDIGLKFLDFLIEDGQSFFFLSFFFFICFY